MAKLVKLTDRVGARLEARAKSEGVSMAKEVEKLLDLAYERDWRQDINAQIDVLADKFAQGMCDIQQEIKKAFDDTLVDRVASAPAKQPKQAFIPTWDIARTALYDIAQESDYINPAVYDTFVNSDMADEFAYYVQDNQLRYTWHGADFPILNLSPQLTQFLTEKGVL